MAFATIVVEIPDSVDPAAAEVKLTDSIENTVLVSVNHTATTPDVIEYHHEKITADPEGD
jgi:hypothetical protein